MEFKDFNIGNRQPFFLISGNCVIESQESAIETAGKLKEITDSLNILLSINHHLIRPIEVQKMVSVVLVLKQV